MNRAPVLAVAVLAMGLVSAHVPAAPSADPQPASVAAAPTFDPAIAVVRAQLARYQTGLMPVELDGLARTIVAEARDHDLSVDLVLAVMHVESRFNAFAVSPVGAMGLMQLLPGTGREMAEQRDISWRGAQTLFDPETNVRLGITYLKWLEKRYDRIDVALAAYNWGPGRIDRKIRAGFPVPQGYADDVLEARSRRFAHTLRNLGRS
jgi:soluble lytic murein transglycosylase-like protein